jgi:hypothetical protein
LSAALFLALAIVAGEGAKARGTSQLRAKQNVLGREKCNDIRPENKCKNRRNQQKKKARMKDRRGKQGKRTTINGSEEIRFSENMS